MAAAADIAALDGDWRSAFGLSPGDRNGPTYVSTPIALPDRWLLVVDFGCTPVELIRTVPELVAARLAAAGVREASIAADWLASHHPPGTSPVGVVVSAELALDWPVPGTPTPLR